LSGLNCNHSVGHDVHDTDHRAARPPGLGNGNIVRIILAKVIGPVLANVVRPIPANEGDSPPKETDWHSRALCRASSPGRMRVIENPSGTSLAHRPPSPVAGTSRWGFLCPRCGGPDPAGPIYRSGREPLPFSPAACLAWRRSDLSLNAASRLLHFGAMPAGRNPRRPSNQ
jgi:hypothetical protein